jgi:hypothetical protein
MVLQLSEQARIEDPRNYGPAVVNALRVLLAAGVSAQHDPRREHFYELEDGENTFYIHISPVNGDVVLLARWLSSPKDVCIPPSPRRRIGQTFFWVFPVTRTGQR